MCINSPEAALTLPGRGFYHPIMKISPAHQVTALGALAMGLVLVTEAARADADALRARIATIERAVVRGDAAALCAGATRSGRVRIELSGLADARGSYGPGQLQVVLQRVFTAFETRAFAFEDDPRTGEPTVFARGVWVRRAREGGDEARDTLTFALRLEEGEWRIVEIRSFP